MFKVINLLSVIGSAWQTSTAKTTTSKKAASLTGRIMTAADEIEKADDDMDRGEAEAMAFMIVTTSLKHSKYASLSDETFRGIAWALDELNYEQMTKEEFLDVFKEFENADDLAAYLDSIREELEPNYGANIVQFILEIFFYDSNYLTREEYEFITKFLDKDFDIVLSYEDFLLEF